MMGTNFLSRTSWNNLSLKCSLTALAMDSEFHLCLIVLDIGGKGLLHSFSVEYHPQVFLFRFSLDFKLLKNFGSLDHHDTTKCMFLDSLSSSYPYILIIKEY